MIKIIFPLVCIFGFLLIMPGWFVFADTLREINKLEGPVEQKAAEELIVRPRVEYGAQGFKDPFRGYRKKTVDGVDTKSITLPSLVIQGVVWGSETPQAIINNKVVKPGDTIENVHIVDITKKGIDVMFEGRQFNLPAPASSNFGQANPISEGGNNEN